MSESAWQPPESEANASPQVHILLAPAYSFFSPALYRDVARRWTGTGLGYLALIALCSWGPIAIVAQVGLHRASGEFEAASEQIPEVHIRDGRLSSPIAQPAIWDLGGETVVLDTTGTADPDVLERARLVITDTEIRDRREYQRRSTSLSQIEAFDMDAQIAREWMHWFVTWAVPVTLPFAFVWTLLWRSVWGLVYGGIIAASAKVPFSTGFRVGMVAITPMLAIDTLWWLISWTPPLWTLLSLGVVGGYLALAITAIRQPRSS